MELNTRSQFRSVTPWMRSVNGCSVLTGRQPGLDSLRLYVRRPALRVIVESLEYFPENLFDFILRLTRRVCTLLPSSQDCPQRGCGATRPPTMYYPTYPADRNRCQKKQLLDVRPLNPKPPRQILSAYPDETNLQRTSSSRIGCHWPLIGPL